QTGERPAEWGRDQQTEERPAEWGDQQTGERPAEWGETSRLGRDQQSEGRPADWGETSRVRGDQQSFFLGLLGLLGTLVATVMPYWRTSAHVGSNIVTAVASMRGLWMECVYQSTGVFQCETYNSLLALPADLQASRALMVLSLVLSVLAIAVATLGMQCTVCLEGAGAAAKGRAAGTGGALFATAGFLSLIPVSWTTHEVVQTFYQPGLPSSMKFELGESLYLGLASSLVSLLGGALLCTSFCQEGDRGHRRGAGGYPYPVGMGGGVG
ncbi:hypothetical protein CRUP_029332, partial [Coryphaenoides rupestris]